MSATYKKLANYYDQLYGFKDYVAACGSIKETINHYHPGASTLLDVGCGTGKHIEQLQGAYRIEGLDLAPDMLEIAKSRCPGVPLHLGSMVDFELDRRFDVITCLFGSIVYVVSSVNLMKTFRSFARHLNDGGLLLVEPWVSPDQYWENNIVLNTSQANDTKIAWMYVGERDGLQVRNHIHYLVGEPDGVTHFTETHQLGLFSKDDYTTAIVEAGLSLLAHDTKGPFGYGLFIARRG